MMGVNLSAGGSLQWFRNALCQAVVAEAKKKKVDAYTLLTAEAEAVAAGQPRPVLPALPLRRADAARRPRRPRLLHRPDAFAPAGPHGPRDPGGRDLFHAGEPGDFRGPGGADPADPRLGRRGPQRLVAADPGRRLRPQGGHDQQRGRRRPTAWRCLAAVGAGEYKDIAEACAATIRVVSETAPARPRRRSTTPPSPSISSFTGRSRAISRRSRAWGDDRGSPHHLPQMLDAPARPAPACRTPR